MLSLTARRRGSDGLDAEGFEFGGAQVKVRTVTDSRLFPSSVIVTGRANGSNQVAGIDSYGPRLFRRNVLTDRRHC
jgi:hypothetical protein